MSEAIIAALITGVLAFAGVLISNNSTQKLTAYKIDELKTDTAGKITDLKEDFNNLKEKVEKHNQVVERLAKCEQSVKSAHRRIDDMRGGQAHD